MLATAAPAAAREVTTLLVTPGQPVPGPPQAAVGLYVPGVGLYVSREEALERLGDLPDEPCGELERCPIELFVGVPPLGSQPNTRRYRVTILGGGYRGVLVSESTRIRGLVSIADVRETIDALEEGREPPIGWRESPRPLVELARLDRRLAAARDAHLPATVALTIVVIALAALAYATRSPWLARTALLYPLAAISLALLVAALERTGPLATTVAVLLAAPAALGLAGLVRLTLAVPLFVGAYGLVLAASPETNSLMAIGPHPWSGGRFYGVTNLLGTLLLAPILATASLLAGWRFAGFALLSLLVVGGSETGADGGGLVVLATALAVVWLRVRRRAVTPLALVAALCVAVTLVALDALAGGSSHVVDALRAGPGELLETLRARAETSVAIATSSPWQLAALVGGAAVLGWLAALQPRSPAVDALIAGIVLSLLVNDSPTKVVGYGAIMCVALRAWAVSRERRVGIESTS